NNIALVNADIACSSPLAHQAAALPFTVNPATDALTVVKIQTPAAPVTAGPVTYKIVVTNTGTSTVTSITVTDTIAAQVTGATTDQPAGFVAAAQGGASA